MRDRVEETKSASPHLLRPISIRGMTAKNRIVISPMCTYSAKHGLAGDFHFAHLAQYALGGAGIVFTEATSVSAEGRISAEDLGLYNDAQIEPLKQITAFLKSMGTVPGVQLGHAGRRAAGRPGWFTVEPLDETDAAKGSPPWEIIAPSALAADKWPTPREMSKADISANIEQWVVATKRAIEAGFEIVEIHGAHGYLIHEFLSPLANRRADEYGGSLENRMRFALQVAEAVRGAWPKDQPLFFRVSAVDGSDWTIEDTVRLATELRPLGVDLVDCSSGGIGGPAAARATPRGFGFQVPFAEEVRKRADIATMAVGLIIDPAEAEKVVASGRADLVAVARAALDDPYWPLHAHRDLVGNYRPYPDQYRGWLEKRVATLARISQSA